MESASSCMQLFLCLCIWGLFFCGFQHLPVYVWDFGRHELTSFYSAIFHLPPTLMSSNSTTSVHVRPMYAWNFMSSLQEHCHLSHFIQRPRGISSFLWPPSCHLFGARMDTALSPWELGFSKGSMLSLRPGHWAQCPQTPGRSPFQASSPLHGSTNIQPWKKYVIGMRRWHLTP